MTVKNKITLKLKIMASLRIHVAKTLYLPILVREYSLKVHGVFVKQSISLNITIVAYQ